MSPPNFRSSTWAQHQQVQPFPSQRHWGNVTSFLCEPFAVPHQVSELRRLILPPLLKLLEVNRWLSHDPQKAQVAQNPFISAWPEAATKMSSNLLWEEIPSLISVRILMKKSSKDLVASWTFIAFYLSWVHQQMMIWAHARLSRSCPTLLQILLRNSKESFKWIIIRKITVSFRNKWHCKCVDLRCISPEFLVRGFKDFH